MRGTEHHHGDLLLGEGGAGLLPGAAVGTGLVQALVEQAGPQPEDVLDLLVFPGLLAGHQVDVELVAVLAHVDVVERAHRRPAVLVGEADRDATVRLDLLGQRDVVVPVLRGLVALLLERALPVEQRPRVVVDRHEVLLAVRAGRGGLERVGEAVQAAPDVADVLEVALLGEELHPVPGEPGGHVVRVGLQVPGDVRLIVVVRHGVYLDRVARLLRVAVHHRLQRLHRRRVGVVRAEGDVLLLGATATAAAPAASRARREQSGHGDHTCAKSRATEERAPRKLARGEQGLRHYPSYVQKEWRIGWGIPTEPFKTHHSPAPEWSDVKGLGPLRFKSVT